MLKPGVRVKSAVWDAGIMVIKASEGDDPTCGDVAMAEAPDKVDGDPEKMNGCLIGKRDVNEAETVEVLCVKSGDGSIYYNGAELMTKDTKKLPSSD